MVRMTGNDRTLLAFQAEADALLAALGDPDMIAAPALQQPDTTATGY
jgi:hypothetical protein